MLHELLFKNVKPVSVCLVLILFIARILGKDNVKMGLMCHSMLLKKCVDFSKVLGCSHCFIPFFDIWEISNKCGRMRL